MDIDEVEFFWMELLGLSRRSARKHVVNHFPTSSSGKRTRKLPYGVCSLKVKRSTRIVQHIYGAIQEYSGIEQPGWLDGPPRKAGVGTLVEQHLQQSLLGVEAVLGLVEDR